MINIFFYRDGHTFECDGQDNIPEAVHAHNCVLVSKATIIYKNALYGRSFF